MHVFTACHPPIAPIAPTDPRPTSRKPTVTSQEDVGTTEEATGSQTIVLVLIAVSALLAMLFLLSLLLIAVLVLCVLRLKNQLIGMKGVR